MKISTDARLSGSFDAELVHFLTEIKKLYENKGFDLPTVSSTFSGYNGNLIIIREVIKKV